MTGTPVRFGLERVVGAAVGLAWPRTRAVEAVVEDEVLAAAAAAGLGTYQFTLRPAGRRTATASAAGVIVCMGAALAWAQASWILRLLLAWVLTGALIVALAALPSCTRRTWHFFEEGAVVSHRGRAASIRMRSPDIPGS